MKVKSSPHVTVVCDHCSQQVFDAYVVVYEYGWEYEPKDVCFRCLVKAINTMQARIADDLA